MVKDSIFLSSTIISCFSAIILFSCESHEQKADEVFEQVKVERMMSKDTAIINKALQPPEKTDPLKKNEYIDEWTKFKMETERKIVANENLIKEIKTIPNASAKLLKEVTSLEQENNDLRKEMDVYKEEAKVLWENFKTQINHDVNKIGIDLKDIKINNKK